MGEQRGCPMGYGSSRKVSRRAVLGFIALGGLASAVPITAVAAGSSAGISDQLAGLLANGRSLDGRGNNLAHPDWGAAGTPFPRMADAAYPDGRGAMMGGPPARFISNRVMDSLGQHLFSENNASEWVWVWGQFVDHGIDMRDTTPGENAPIGFDPNDPLERFGNDLGLIDFQRTPAAPGTGRAGAPREQINQISSYIDASQIYGVSSIRLDWLRDGPLGDPAQKSAKLLMPEDFLPRTRDRDPQIAAPLVELDGPLAEHPELARVAGDLRANENMPLTLAQTLFAREHNRIVDQLPASLSEEQKFQLARRVVGAEIQFITYNEFLPALGIQLPQYQGYDQSIDASIRNEFGAVGYRMHAMVHGELDPQFNPGDYSDAELNVFKADGIAIQPASGGQGTLAIPLNTTFGNPDLLGQVGFGRLAKEFAEGKQYRNNELMSDTMRAVLFQKAEPGSRDPSLCFKAGIVSSDCFNTVMDLAAIDVQRGRDHGIPRYNDLRAAYGLARQSSFTDITGENTDQFPANDQQLTSTDPINDPHIMDFVQLLDINDNVIDASNAVAVQQQVVTGIRRTTLAARLRAVYGSVDNVDAFVGMTSEPHPIGKELGELQEAILRDQFTRLRDGDRFHFANDSALPLIEQEFGITFQHSLAEIIQLNTGTQTQPNVFRIPATQ
ncbi:MAG TPA: peroxidase family protein [Pseudonocardiaceae bacterium]|nr:peroxidase family protein [Pseudonocardiaceae bacterium]